MACWSGRLVRSRSRQVTRRIHDRFEASEVGAIQAAMAITNPPPDLGGYGLQAWILSRIRTAVQASSFAVSLNF